VDNSLFRGDGQPFPCTLFSLHLSARLVESTEHLEGKGLTLFFCPPPPLTASWEWDDLNWDYGAEPEALVVVRAHDCMKMTRLECGNV
jgi:hypothetical protein